MRTIVNVEVFISYSSSDQALAERVRDDLESDGIPCWMAPRDVPPAGDYAKAILDAIESCNLLLVLLSASANVSPHIEREAHLAAARKIPILPVRVEPVTPEGALRFLLVNVQWIDAFPRVEPRLEDIRAKVRALLEQAGRPIVRSRPSRYQRVLAAAAAWAVVIGLMALATAWLHGRWLNLIPYWQVPMVAVRQAQGLVLALAAIPALALILQYIAHRNLSHVLWLDALFAVRGSRGARARTAGALAFAIALAVLIARTPPSVTVELVQGPIDSESELTRAVSCSTRNYVIQANSYYAIRTRVGAMNPPGSYRLRVELGPYATSDGVEFCEVRVDEALGASTLVPMPDDARRAGFVQLEGTREVFAGTRMLVLNASHYRDARPSDECWIRATLSLDGGEVHDAEQLLASSIWVAR